ncbi:MAG: pseudouridine synthase [Bdellovibrionales bacterium]
MLPILYQDQDIVVVNKRSGLLVHRSAIDTKAEEFAMQILRDQLGQRVYPVHRLDRPTSGALLFALSSENARELSLVFSEGRVSKTYLAVVRGNPPSEVLVDHPLKEELDEIADKKARVDKPAQPAVTKVFTLASVELPMQVDKFPTARYSLVKAIPITGRKHQIRRHLRHLGHPIIGDVSHGSGKHNRFFRNQFQVNRLLLACTQISFLHPKENKMITVEAPLAEEFKQILHQLGWTHVV